MHNHKNIKKSPLFTSAQRVTFFRAHFNSAAFFSFLSFVAMISLSAIRRIFILTLASALLMLTAIIILRYLFATGDDCMELKGGEFSVTNRKLLQGEPITKVATAAAPAPGAGTLAARKEETNRIWGDKCSRSDIVINQGPTSPLPNGIPTYTVEIMNVCLSGCNISGIHLNCGWFSSARFINPRVFKRLRYNDCLVNDGKSLINGRTVSFQYANTFYYPLSVSSVFC